MPQTLDYCDLKDLRELKELRYLSVKIISLQVFEILIESLDKLRVANMFCDTLKDKKHIVQWIQKSGRFYEAIQPKLRINIL